MVKENKTLEVRKQRFLKTKQRRLDAVKKALEGLRKLSIKSNHHYEPEDVEEITKFLSKELYKTIHKFSANADDRWRCYIEAELEHYDYLSKNDKALYDLIKKKAPHLSEFWNFLDNQEKKENKLEELSLSEMSQALSEMSRALQEFSNISSEVAGKSDRASEELARLRIELQELNWFIRDNNA